MKLGTSGLLISMRVKVQGRHMQARFIEIHKVLAKQNKVWYFSNKVINMYI